jgi:hypothetical protein
MRWNPRTGTALMALLGIGAVGLCQQGVDLGSVGAPAFLLVLRELGAVGSIAPRPFPYRAMSERSISLRRFHGSMIVVRGGIAVSAFVFCLWLDT